MNRCEACAKYLYANHLMCVIGGKSYCGPDTSECAYIGRWTKNWTLTPIEAQQMLEQLFDERGAA